MVTARFRAQRVRNVSTVVCLAALLAGCSSDEGKSGEAAAGTGGVPGTGNGMAGMLNVSGNMGRAGSGSGNGFGGASAGLLEGVDGRVPGSGVSVEPILPGAECAGEAFDGESIPLELLIMMDRSVSMGDAEPAFLLPGGGRKWDAVRKGFAEFFELPQAQLLKVGIDFFSQSSCDPESYATPEVNIGAVPTTAPQILASYDAHEPGENTPIGPALEGALMHADEYRRAHPGVQVAVVLVTDGVPNGCGTTTAEARKGAALIAPIAERYASGSSPISTYVLGIQGIEVSAEDFTHVVTTIANAGGTEPVIVQATDNLAQKFATALDQIRESAAPPCTYGVPLPPEGEQLDLNMVNVVLEPPTSEPEAILNVAGKADCQYGGWYYDPPTNPTSIQLCPNTCEVVSTLTGSSFKVLFGCGTVGGGVE